MKLRVMTYNIQHGNVHLGEGIDLSRVCDVIGKAGSDIIGLNEVRGRGMHSDYTAQVETMASLLGYHCYFGRSIYVGGTDPYGNPYGNAVLSKYPIVEASVVKIPDPIFPSGRVESRSICRAVVEVVKYGEIRQLTVLSSHFGLSREEQEHAASTALSVCESERLPFVLMGDFNVTPDDPVLAPLYKNLNDTDSLLSGGKTFPSHNPENKIDYIFTSKNVTINSAEIINAVASDHLPITADIEF